MTTLTAQPDTSFDTSALNICTDLPDVVEKETNEPRWDLVEQYLPLVKSIVAKMRSSFPAHIDVEDIYSIAVSGVISASRNFDPEKGHSFGNYAKLRVRGALLDELRRMDWMPRQERVNTKHYKNAVEALEQKLNREVTDEEICAELKISPKENAKMKEQRKGITLVTLDSPSNNCDPEAPSLHDAIGDVTQANGRDLVQDKETLTLLRKLLGQLPEIPQKVLTFYYLKGMRLGEIAEVFNLTESRICQIHSQALSQLRNHLTRAMDK